MGTLMVLLSIAFVPTGFLAQRDPESFYDIGDRGETHGYTHIRQVQHGAYSRQKQEEGSSINCLSLVRGHGPTSLAPRG